MRGSRTEKYPDLSDMSASLIGGWMLDLSKDCVVLEHS